MFITSKSKIPKPPPSFGKHKVCQLTNWYFFFPLSPLQRKFDLIVLHISLGPIGILWKENMYNSILHRDEFTRVTLPPKPNIFPFQGPSFFPILSSEGLQPNSFRLFSSIRNPYISCVELLNYRSKSLQKQQHWQCPGLCKRYPFYESLP
jgi:hypothetical protein